ncbi:hypothetical protein HK099_002998 [Clydaea vesicula]|uniref:Alginate lyase 2 domain-containing protein n=1 Tax=Clydaea vesicula TaxID=447962 RepID=A0AAD5Y0I1_9FUNG|nr:hypothetical protein HK099_002998 [Clydaea vesicula]KAJ3385883.1 hypothetical protein HDU92_002821 [Lobulomyces angularis]
MKLTLIFLALTTASNAQLPNLSDFFLQLPVGKGTKMDTIKSDLSLYQSEFFTQKDNAYVFHTPVKPPNAAHSPGTKTVRTELREVQTWQCNSGDHSLKFTAKITSVSPNKQSVIIAQIHDGHVPNLFIRYEQGTLNAFVNRKRHELAPMSLNEVFSMEILSKDAFATVFLNGKQVLQPIQLDTKGAEVYFKAGSYQQATTEDDSADSVAEVYFYDIHIDHENNQSGGAYNYQGSTDTTPTEFSPPPPGDSDEKSDEESEKSDEDSVEPTQNDDSSENTKPVYTNNSAASKESESRSKLKSEKKKNRESKRKQKKLRKQNKQKKNDEKSEDSQAEKKEKISEPTETTTVENFQAGTYNTEAANKSDCKQNIN